MRFSKYQGIGNDFVMLADPGDSLRLEPELVRRFCDRRFGIGADGAIRVAPGSGGADLIMDYVNSDGSVGEMCGNGIRCLALFAQAEGMTNATEISVGTLAGIKTVWVQADGRVRVDMGAPMFAPGEIPVRWDGADALHAKIDLDEGMLEATCLSMGNPHAVLFVDDPATSPVTTVGPLIEVHPMFPNKTNVEFARVDSPDHVSMRVWERGSGETLACGTGAAAVAVAARLVRSADEALTVALPGGDLQIEWAGGIDQPEPLFMTGPAVKSFEGDIDI
jgi:diaminopimelate epimerase